MLSSIMNTALSGLQANQRKFLDSSRQIARWGTGDGSVAPGPPNLETEMVNVLNSRRGLEANLAVVGAADRMLGTLIDTLA